MTLIIIYFFIIINGVIGAKLLNCPTSDIKFEKVLGLRPSHPNRSFVLHKSNNNRPITLECITKCMGNTNCQSFVIYYNMSTCFGFENTINSRQEVDNVIDSGVAWFIKICLKQTINCGKLWIFERIPGSILVGNNTKKITGDTTRTDCQQYCLAETEFTCRSAKFQIKNDHTENEITGVCILSAADRHNSPNSFRISNYDDEYFENQCSVQMDNHNQFCAYEEFENATFQEHSDLYFTNQTKESCQNLCDTNSVFNCRAFTIIFISIENYLCLLHSENSKIFGPTILKPDTRAKYFEKTQCLNITILCSETSLTVHFLPKMDFKGMLYMDGYSEQPECSAFGLGYNQVVLKLSLLDNKCGLIRATAPYNRTLMAGSMILQYNKMIQTHNDRLIRVGCVYGNDSQLVVGTGVTIGTNVSNKGSMIFNISNTIKTPTVEMKLIDLNTKKEVSDTQIGQDLELVIEMKPSDGIIDIWAYHLIAMTEKSDESIFLLDNNGCPTNTNIFPALTKIVSNNSVQLRGKFQAFKFSSSPIVRFSVILQFCSKKCPEVHCKDQRNRVKRQNVDPTKHSINATITPQILGNNKGDNQLPLQLLMVVRNPGAYTDRLVLGDQKILVAGYDFVRNEICLDFSLFTGLILILVLVQIILFISCVILVRRYKRLYLDEIERRTLTNLHRNFEVGYSDLDNRRVHWADNDFT